MRLLVLAIPTELAAGRYPAPAWAILVIAGAVIAGAAAYLGVRLWRGRHGTGGSQPPTEPPSTEKP